MHMIPNKKCYILRLKEAQLSVKRITGEKKVETRKINANSLVIQPSIAHFTFSEHFQVKLNLYYALPEQKQRLRQKEANLPVIG